MNHYERLKVSQDAPAEVIRAAYRALAAKLHPDRLSGNGAPGGVGPDDANHTQMAALNGAYEVLIDPKLRREYDATLPALSGMGQRGFAPVFGAGAPGVTGASALQGGSPFGAATGIGGHGSAGPAPGEAAGPSTRVDLNWVPPGVASTAAPFWPPSRRLMLIGGSGIAVLIVATAGVMWQVMGQHQMERAMSNKYSAPDVDAIPKQGDLSPEGELTRHASRLPESMQPPVPVAEAREAIAEPAGLAPEPVNASGFRRPTVDELQRMSDEELLRVLPTLDKESGAPSMAALRAAAKPGGRLSIHPLDGKPLDLRRESQLVDPLADPGQAAAPQAGGRRP